MDYGTTHYLVSPLARMESSPSMEALRRAAARIGMLVSRTDVKQGRLIGEGDRNTATPAAHNRDRRRTQGHLDRALLRPGFRGSRFRAGRPTARRPHPSPIGSDPNNTH